MDEFDEFASDLLEEAKRFREKALSDGSDIAKQAYRHAALLLSVSGLEAFVNGVASDFFDDIDFLNIVEMAFLKEREVELKNGVFQISSRLRMSRLTERIEVLFSKFDYGRLDKNSDWWGGLKDALDLRNNLVHPKEKHEITDTDVERAIASIISCIDNLFVSVYSRSLPKNQKLLESKYNF